MHFLSVALTFLTTLALQTTALPTTQLDTSQPALEFPPLFPDGFSLASSKSLSPSFALSTPHSKRDVMQVANWVPGWTLVFEDFDMILPGMPSIEGLGAFYEAVEGYAVAAATKLPYTTNPITVIDIGEMQLKIACSVAHVPWSFVTNFAQMLAFMTKHNGFTAFYEARLVNAAAGVIVNLSVHLRQVAAAA